MKRSRLGSLRPAAGGLRLAACAALALSGSGSAFAAVTNLTNVDAPIVHVNIRQGNVTIRTWTRSAVAIDGDPGLVIRRSITQQPDDPAPMLIPKAPGDVPSGSPQLAAESFVVPMPPGAREQVVIKSRRDQPSGASTPLTVTVPADSVMVFARTGRGHLTVRDYRAGTLLGFVSRGRLTLVGVGGNVFAETIHGPIVATDSSFEHLRARSLSGNITFERCRVRQIEATSVDGSIVYDAGRFDAGLARFETTRGDIAVGSSGPANLEAHEAGDGRVYTRLSRDAHDAVRNAEATAQIGGGGPVVTITSQGGNIFMYDGSLRNHIAGASPIWDAPLTALQRPGVERRAESPRAASAEPRLYPPPYYASPAPASPAPAATPHKRKRRPDAVPEPANS